MFRLTASIVFAHIAKTWLLKLKLAQNTKDKDKQTVFPQRMEPSQIIELKFAYFFCAHHVKINFCFYEKVLK